MKHLRKHAQRQSNSPTPSDPRLIRRIADELEDRELLHSEPFWMQDVRLAQRAIEEQRAQARRDREAGGRSSSQDQAAS